MKAKYENLERIIFFVLLAIVVLTIPVVLAKTIANNKMIDKKMQMLVGKKSENLSKMTDLDQKYLMADDKTVRDPSTLTAKRNIFTPRLTSKGIVASIGDSVKLLVSEIGLKPLEIEYRGRVFFKDKGDMVAQVNVHKKSYLVKKGTSFAAYKVYELNGDLIKLTDKKGKNIEIKYREKTYTNELVAQIKELVSGYSKTVSKNDTFLEYKVLDIDEESVLVSLLGQHLRLEKGMVHK